MLDSTNITLVAIGCQMHGASTKGVGLGSLPQGPRLYTQSRWSQMRATRGEEPTTEGAWRKEICSVWRRLASEEGTEPVLSSRPTKDGKVGHCGAFLCIYCINKWNSNSRSQGKRRTTNKTPQLFRLTHQTFLFFQVFFQALVTFMQKCFVAVNTARPNSELSCSHLASHTSTFPRCYTNFIGLIAALNFTGCFHQCHQ